MSNLMIWQIEMTNSKQSDYVVLIKIFTPGTVHCKLGLLLFKVPGVRVLMFVHKLFEPSNNVCCLCSLSTTIFICLNTAFTFGNVFSCFGNEHCFKFNLVHSAEDVSVFLNKQIWIFEWWQLQFKHGVLAQRAFITCSVWIRGMSINCQCHIPCGYDG